MSISAHERTADSARHAGAECMRVEDLSIRYGDGPASVSHVDLHMRQGEILGVIGDSGCGKSSIGLAILGLLPSSAVVTAETFEVAGHDYTEQTEETIRSVRGRDVSMIFQEPMNALNPLIRVGAQIEEVLLIHHPMTKAQASARALQMLRMVQVPEPELRMRQFPHQLSGGLRQRVVIAIAMASEPQVLVADEPTTALDVTVQAQVLTLLSELRDRTGTGIVLISHDLGVIANTCDRVAVMYAGEVIEEGTTAEVLESPQHPYTQGLLASIPAIGEAGPPDELTAIPGSVTDADRSVIGCRFAARCAFATEACAQPQELRLIPRPQQTDDDSGASSDETVPSAPHRARCVLVDQMMEEVTNG